MLHNRFKLITNPHTIILDRAVPVDSDIDDEEKKSEGEHCRCARKHTAPPSLLASVNLRGRKETKYDAALKIEAVELMSSSEEQDSESLVFVRKIADPDSLKRRLRRLANVANKVKLQRMEEQQGSITCSICLNDLKEVTEGQIGRLNCKHLFCFSCILESSKFSNRCPYCRTTFSFIRHGTKKTHIQAVQRQQEYDDPLDEPCYICGRNDDFERLLQCQYCEYAYCHTYCDTRLNSDQPPAGHWYCLSCSQLLQHNPNDVIFQDQP